MRCPVLGLTKHLVTHPEYRNDPNFKDAEIFTCEVCEKIFTRENYLERHMEMKHDDEHARAYQIYKQKFVKKHPPPLPLSQASDEHLQSPNGLLASQRQLSMEAATQALALTSQRSETITKPPSASPSGSEMDEGSSGQVRAQVPMSHETSVTSSMSGPPPGAISHSESFHSERSTPNGRAPAPNRDAGSCAHWNNSGDVTPRQSPRVFSGSDEQQHPFDMSQPRAGVMQSPTPRPPPQHPLTADVTSAPPPNLPVFPEPYTRQNGRCESPSSSDNRPYLHRLMAASSDQDQRPYLARSTSTPHPAPPPAHASYNPYMRSSLPDGRSMSVGEGREDEGGRAGVGMHYHREEHRSMEEDYYSRVNLHNNDVFRSPPPSDAYLERRHHSKSDMSGSDVTTRHDDHHLASQFDRFFGVARASSSSSNHDMRAPMTPHPQDDTRYHDYAGYGSSHLFPGSHSPLARDRFPPQFPFHISPTALPTSGFAHSMHGQRPNLGGQYPQYPRSEEEIAQALESIARAYRPYR